MTQGWRRGSTKVFFRVKTFFNWPYLTVFLSWKLFSLKFFYKPTFYDNQIPEQKKYMDTKSFEGHIVNQTWKWKKCAIKLFLQWNVVSASLTLKVLSSNFQDVSGNFCLSSFVSKLFYSFLLLSHIQFLSHVETTIFILNGTKFNLYGAI